MSLKKQKGACYDLKKPYPDLIQQYAKDGIMPACHIFKEGQEFVLDWDSYSVQGIPESFCTLAWNSISELVFSALATGALFYTHALIKNPVAGTTCRRCGE